MIRKLAEKIVDAQIARHRLSPSDIEVYQYGYELVLNLFINVLLTLVIGVLFSKVLSVFLFFGSYSALRVFAGGYHARNHEKCLVVSIVITIVVCLILCGIPQSMFLLLTVINLLISIPVIWLLVPVEDFNKPLSKNERVVYRKKARTILLVQSIISLVAAAAGLYAQSYILSLSVFILCITLLMGIAKNKASTG